MRALAEGPFRALRYRNFRLFWLGYLISNAGSWMQNVAQGWLVYEISGSAVWLGMIGMTKAAPLIFLSLIGGAVADRFDKRRTLFVTLSVNVLGSLLLGLLTLFGVVQVWHVLVISIMTACAQAFEQPARQSLMPTLVEKKDLHAAISLSAIAFNGAAAFGPSLTGILVPLFGLAGCFFVNTATFAAIFFALFKMEFPPLVQRKVQVQSMGADVIEGIRYVRQNPVILAIISMAALNSFLARPYHQFLTVFAADVFKGDVGLLGLMQTATAVGTILFMLVIASLYNVQFKGKLLVMAGVGFALSLIAFAWAPGRWTALGLLVLVGGFNMTYMTTTNTLLQANVDDGMRGRVMSTYTVTAVGLMPLGQGPMGYSMEWVGPQWALTFGAGFAMLWILYMALFRVRSVWRLP